MSLFLNPRSVLYLNSNLQHPISLFCFFSRRRISTAKQFFHLLGSRILDDFSTEGACQLRSSSGQLRRSSYHRRSRSYQSQRNSYPLRSSSRFIRVQPTTYNRQLFLFLWISRWTKLAIGKRWTKRSVGRNEVLDGFFTHTTNNLLTYNVFYQCFRRFSDLRSRVSGFS